MDDYSHVPQPPQRRPAALSEPARLPWLVGLLLVMLVFLLTPRLVDQVSYSITRGRERAEVESAGGIAESHADGNLSRVRNRGEIDRAQRSAYRYRAVGRRIA